MYFYLAALLVSLTGLLYADRKFKLVVFRNKKYFGLCILASILFFLAWDLVGIALDVFATNQKYVSGVFAFTPDLPLEEFLFLVLLSYVTLIVWRLAWQHTS